MKISINKKSKDDHLRRNFFELFSSKFSNQGRLGSYCDKSSSSFSGVSFRFIRGEMVQTAGPSSNSKVKITLEFEPDVAVDINKLEDEIKLFLEQDFNLSSSEYILEGVYSNALKY